MLLSIVSVYNAFVVRSHPWKVDLNFNALVDTGLGEDLGTWTTATNFTLLASLMTLPRFLVKHMVGGVDHAEMTDTAGRLMSWRWASTSQ
jgi:hypothetical protein